MSLRYRVPQLSLAIVVVSLILGACSDRPIRPPVTDYPTAITLVETDSAEVVEYRSPMNLIFLPGTVNGQDSAWFILDTGFPYSLVNRDRLDRALINFGPTRFEAMPCGNVQISTVYGMELTFGNVSITADSMRAFSLGSLEPIAGHRIDGIIGHDLFEQFAVSVDYLTRTVTLENAGDFSYTGNGAEIEVIVENGEPFIVAEVMHPDGTWRTARLKLDTGSSDFIGFNGSFAQAEGLFPDDWPKIPALGVAVGGQTENWVTRLYQFRLGDFMFDSPIVGFSVDTIRAGDAGTIGAEFLRRFKVTFDFARDRMFLERNENYETEFAFDQSGMFVTAVAPDFKEKVIMAVQPGSLADQMGIKAGDILARIEGYNSPNITVSDIRERLTNSGRVTLLLKRGKSARKYVMMLKPMI